MQGGQRNLQSAQIHVCGQLGAGAASHGRDSLFCGAGNTRKVRFSLLCNNHRLDILPDSLDSLCYLSVPQAVPSHNTASRQNCAQER